LAFGKSNTKGKTLPLITLITRIHADQNQIGTHCERLQQLLKHFVPRASLCGSGFSQDIQTGNSMRE
jgi:hypothetical protein